MKLGVLIGSLAALYVLAGAELASAHVKKYPTSATIDYRNLDGPPDDLDYFEGRVKSRASACRRERTVYLVQEVPGTDILWTPPVISAPDGSWHKTFEDAELDQYYALVLKRRTGSGQHRHICKRGTSPLIQAGP